MPYSRAPGGNFTDRLVGVAASLGMTSLQWTMDTEDNMNANLDKGVDAVVTNRPNILGRVLQQRAADS